MTFLSQYLSESFSIPQSPGFVVRSSQEMGSTLKVFKWVDSVSMSFSRKWLLLLLHEQSPDLEISCCRSSDDVRRSGRNISNFRMKVDPTKLWGSIERSYLLAKIWRKRVGSIPDITLPARANCKIEGTLLGKNTSCDRIGISILSGYGLERDFFGKSRIELLFCFKAILALFILLDKISGHCSLHRVYANGCSSLLCFIPVLRVCNIRKWIFHVIRGDRSTTEWL